MTTYSLPAWSNSAATLRPTRPNPQMMVWSRSWPMALLLRPLSEVLPDDPARDQLDDRARKVEEDCHARQEHDDGEELGGGSFGARVEPGQRRRDDRAVERRRPALVGEQDEADGADREHDDERDLRDEEAPEAEPLHGLIVCGAALRGRQGLSSSGSARTRVVPGCPGRHLPGPSEPPESLASEPSSRRSSPEPPPGPGRPRAVVATSRRRRTSRGRRVRAGSDRSPCERDESLVAPPSARVRSSAQSLPSPAAAAGRYRPSRFAFSSVAVR